MYVVGIYRYQFGKLPVSCILGILFDKFQHFYNCFYPIWGRAFNQFLLKYVDQSPPTQKKQRPQIILEILAIAKNVSIFYVYLYIPTHFFIEKVWESTRYTVFHGCCLGNQSSGTKDQN